MNNTFLYTLPQWFIFAAIFVISYGWIESKKSFRLIGISILILLGVYSLIILLGDSFAASKFLTFEEIASEELDEEIIDEIPFQAKLLPAYLSFVFSSVIAIIAFLLEIKDKKWRLYITIFAGLVSLFGFFIIVGAVRAL